MNTRHARWAFRAMVILAIAASMTLVRTTPWSPYLVGAYYYGWYDSLHWGAFDHLGRHLPEPLEPALGEYDSGDPKVVNAHVRWAEDFGIDFFILSWSARDNTADRQARQQLLPHLAQTSVRQAPVIELLAYRETYGQLDLSNHGFRQHLTDDVRYVAEHYLRHPSAMRIDGRPLLFLYVSRELLGDVSGWIDEVRRDLATIGVDPFIVGDEAFWEEIDVGRLRPYDAITAYNVYDWPLTQHRGYADRSTFFAEVDWLFNQWRAAARAAGVAFVPNVMPGYNDRGVRPADDHFVIPRQVRPGGPHTGFFERSIELAKRYADPDLRMVTVTSFNEWNEWTAIEPTRRASDRASDPDASIYTQGFPHPRYGFEYLELVRYHFGHSRPR